LPDRFIDLSGICSLTVAETAIAVWSGTRSLRSLVTAGSDFEGDRLPHRPRPSRDECIGRGRCSCRRTSRCKVTSSSRRRRSPRARRAADSAGSGGRAAWGMRLDHHAVSG
jgi:hypothetical protein